LLSGTQFPENFIEERLLEFWPLNTINLSWDLWYNLLSIIVIDLILSGDNAVLIAMAVRSLPEEQRKKGFILGAGAAVVLRIVLTFVVSQLLGIPYLKFAGGFLILWIAVKLFVEGAPGPEREREATTIFQAIKIMMIADITMSTDNMLAVAGASQGNLFLLLFGLGLSIPFIVLTSGLLSMLMDRYPIIIYIGAAILGKVGGAMVITDPAVAGFLKPSVYVHYGVEAFCAAGVIVLGKILLRRLIRAEQDLNIEETASHSEPTEEEKE
jgi:YjbE family integral membrane protein